MYDLPSALPPTAHESHLPRISRRSALLGAAGLLAAAPASVLRADSRPTPSGSGVILLNGNENPYGPSPAARRAFLASVSKAPRYADENLEELKRQIAAREGVGVEQVTLGTGSGEILKLCGLLGLMNGLAGELVASLPTYEELPEFASQLGIALRWVPPDAQLRHDLPAMRAAISERTRIVYVCNPNNPTGAALTRDALAGFVRAVPANVMVVADEAYIDFADQPGVASVVGLVNEVPNLVVLRTFSKIHGLAGLRIGYGISPLPIAKRFAALALTWPSTAGIDAATASYNDADFLRTTRAAILADRKRLLATFDRLGLRHSDAQGNFVFFDTGGPLRQFQDRMLAQGIKVGRRFAGFETWSRVTIGTTAEVDRFLAALPKALPG